MIIKKLDEILLSRRSPLYFFYQRPALVIKEIPGAMLEYATQLDIFNAFYEKMVSDQSKRYSDLHTRYGKSSASELQTFYDGANLYSQLRLYYETIFNLIHQPSLELEKAPYYQILAKALKAINDLTSTSLIMPKAECVTNCQRVIAELNRPWPRARNIALAIIALGAVLYTAGVLMSVLGFGVMAGNILCASMLPIAILSSLALFVMWQCKSKLAEAMEGVIKESNSIIPPDIVAAATANMLAMLKRPTARPAPIDDVQPSSLTA